MMRRNWNLGHRSPELYDSEWFITVSEEPVWANMVETVWNTTCTLTRGWIGGHGQSRLYNAVIWRVPMGRPKWDHSEPGQPWLENSLGSALYRLENWVLTRSNDHGRDLAEIPVTEDVARQVDESFVEVMSGLDDAAPGSDLAAEVRRVE